MLPVRGEVLPVQLGEREGGVAVILQQVGPRSTWLGRGSGLGYGTGSGSGSGSGVRVMGFG